MNKILLIILSAFLLAACQETLEEKAEKEAKTFTRKKCPYPVHESIDMDSMTFDKKTHTFIYHYTLKGNLDNEQMMRPEQMRNELLNGVKNMTTAKVYMDEAYSFQYIYHSQRNPEKILFETLFTAEDYQ